jgi:hypothetical protein
MTEISVEPTTEPRVQIASKICIAADGPEEFVRAVELFGTALPGQGSLHRQGRARDRYPSRDRCRRGEMSDD